MRQASIEYKSDRDPAPDRRVLVAVLVATAASAVALWRLSGPPVMRRPDVAAAEDALRGTTLTDADVIATATAIAWLALAYLAATIVLRLMAVLAHRTTEGAAWTAVGLRVTNVVTIPAVRRIVDGGVAGTLLVSSWLPPIPAAAIPGPPAPVVQQLEAVVEVRAPAAVQVVTYTVQPGDDLWRIARTLYGDGSRYGEIVRANAHRTMPDGQPLDYARTLQPGWTLEAPAPAGVSVDGSIVRYTVRHGDHLWGIASRYLGDGMRWRELWDLNGGLTMTDGTAFANWNLIYPGWVLMLPADAVRESTAPPADVTPVRPTALSDPSEAGDSPSQAGETAADDGAALPAWDWSAVPRPVLLTAAGFALLGGAALFVQRLPKPTLPEWPSALRRRAGSGDAGRTVLIARAVAAALRAESSDLRVTEITERDGVVTVMATCARGEEQEVAALADTIAKVLDCAIDAAMVASGRVTFSVAGAGSAAIARGDEAGPRAGLPLPVGVDDEEQITYLDLAGLQSIALVGSDAECRRMLGDWIATLTSTASPDELAFRADAAALAQLGGGLPNAVSTPAETAWELIDELDEMATVRAGTDDGVPVVVLLSVTETELLAAAERTARRVPDVCVIALAAPGLDVAGSGFGAIVSVGGIDAEGDPESAAPIVVEFEDGVRRVMEPVLVRRDGSRRWCDGSRVMAREEVAEARDTISARAATEPRLADELDHEAFVATEDADEDLLRDRYDWRGAVFGLEREDHGVEDGWSDIEAASLPDDGSGDGPMTEATVPVADVAAASAQPEAASRTAVALLEAASRATTRAAPPRQEALFADTAVATADAAEAVIVVHCLGRLEIAVAGAEVQSWPSAKSRELTAFLAVHGSAVARQEIAAALWPQFAFDQSTRHLLSNAVTIMRTLVRDQTGDREQAVILLARDRYSFQRGLLRSDLDEFDAQLRYAASHAVDEEAYPAYDAALDLYRGDFLDGEEWEWLDNYRVEYRRRFLDGACHAGARALAANDAERALRYYHRAVAQVPADEEASRGLMRCYAALGDTNGVHKAYRVLARAVQDELGIPLAGPGAETRSLFRELTEGVASG